MIKRCEMNSTQDCYYHVTNWEVIINWVINDSYLQIFVRREIIFCFAKIKDVQWKYIFFLLWQEKGWHVFDLSWWTCMGEIPVALKKVHGAFHPLFCWLVFWNRIMLDCSCHLKLPRFETAVNPELLEFGMLWLLLFSNVFKISKQILTEDSEGLFLNLILDIEADLNLL